MHTWYTYPVSIGHGGRWRGSRRTRMSVRQAHAGAAGAGADVRLPAARPSSSSGPARPGRSTSGRSTRPSPGSSATVSSSGGGRGPNAPTRAARDLPRHRGGSGEVSAWFTTPVRSHPAAARRARDQARARGHRPRRRRRHRHPAPADRHHGRPAGLHPAQARRPGRHPRPARPTSPGAWCSTRWSSTPRPRSGGSTTARPACGAPPLDGTTHDAGRSRRRRRRAPSTTTPRSHADERARAARSTPSPASTARAPPRCTPCAASPSSPAPASWSP